MQVKGTSSKVRITTRAIPSLHISGRDLMQNILTCAMGLDVHRNVIAACLAKGGLGTDPEIEIRSLAVPKAPRICRGLKELIALKKVNEKKSSS